MIEFIKLAFCPVAEYLNFYKVRFFLSLMKQQIGKANSRIVTELGNIARDLGSGWSIGDFKGLNLDPTKNYAAKGSAQFVYHGVPVSNLVAVMFGIDDNTGAEKWVPRKKEGEAEFYAALGSDVGGEWFSGLTLLTCAIGNSESPLGEGDAFRILTTSRDDYLAALDYRKSGNDLRRYDFTFDRSVPFGDPHVMGFSPEVAQITPNKRINYQIGAFALFSQPSDALNELRERFGKR